MKKLLSLIQFLFIGDIKLVADCSLMDFIDLMNNNKPVIFAINHSRWTDIFVMTEVFKQLDCRYTAIMGNDKVLQRYGFILNKLGCFPHKPNGIKTAVYKILELGENILICPEGWTDMTGKLNEFHTGVSVISFESGSDITPIKINYAQYRGNWILKFPDTVQWFLDALLPRKKGVEVIIGKPFKIQPIEQEYLCANIKVYDFVKETKRLRQVILDL